MPKNPRKFMSISGSFRREISIRMATKESPKNCSTFPLSVKFLPTIFLWFCCTLATTTKTTTTILYETPKNFFDSTIARYMQQIGNDSSLIHFIIQTSTKENFVEKIVNRYSSFEFPSMILSVDPDEEFIDENIKVDSNPGEYSACVKFRHVVGIFETLTAIKPEVWKIRYNEIWNPDAIFAIFVNDETSIDINSAEILLRHFWSIDCANVILVSLESSIIDKIKIFTYDPFAVVSTKRSIKSFAKRGIVYTIGKNDCLFPKKFNDLRGHVITTSFYRHRPHASLIPGKSFENASGMDVEIIRYAARRLNFTIFLRTQDVDATSHVVRLQNGRRVGPIGDVLTGKSDYLGNGQFLEVVHLYNRSLDIVYPYWRSYSVIVVKRAPPLPAIFHWTRERNASLVSWIAGSGLVIFIVYLRIVKSQQGGKILLTILGLLLFQHLPNISRRASDRIFCIFWISCSFIICTIYQGNLVNDLMAPPIYEDIDTLKELVERTSESSLRLMVRPYERRILKQTAAILMDDDIRKKLSELTVEQLNFSACLTQIRLSNNVACTIDKSYGDFALGQVQRYRLMLEKNPDTRISSQARVYLIPPIHIIDEGLIDFWKTYVVRRYFPYLPAINEAIGRTFEFGLIDKWLRDDKAAHFREPPSSKEHRALSLLDMDYTFGILIFGHALATVTFLGELVIARGAKFC